MNPFNKSDVKHLLFLLIASSIVSFPYFFYNQKQGLMAVLMLMIFALISRVAFFLIGVYSLLINSIFLHIVPSWGANSLGSRIQAALESAPYETREYMRTYFGMTDILFILIYVVIALIAIYLVLKKLRVSLLGRATTLLLAIVAIITSLLIYPTVETLRNFQLVHLPLSIHSAYDRLDIINDRNNYLKKQQKKDLKCPNPFQKIIFIQGEAVNKNHMSIYGYERKTTPFLDGVKPFKFDAISPTNQTRFSIPIELTDATVKDFDKFYRSKSIVSTLSECGYTTYWISNQGKRGEFDTTITSIAKEADHTYFLNDLDYTMAGLDDNILKNLDTIETNTNKKQAFFIHLLGSHFSYSDRYPESAALFKEDDVISQYDNSIYYTDTIIAEVYKRFPNKHSLYLYLSDHGEVVEPEEQGHGYSPGFKEEYEVPFVIWSKDSSRISDFHNETNGKLINTETLNHVIEYLIGKRKTSGVSYNQNVMSLQPDNIVDFSKLEKYQLKH